jgi:hypothetical protein
MPDISFSYHQYFAEILPEYVECMVVYTNGLFVADSAFLCGDLFSLTICIVLTAFAQLNPTTCEPRSIDVGFPAVPYSSAS